MNMEQFERIKKLVFVILGVVYPPWIVGLLFKNIINSSADKIPLLVIWIIGAIILGASWGLYIVFKPLCIELFMWIKYGDEK